MDLVSLTGINHQRFSTDVVISLFTYDMYAHLKLVRPGAMLTY